MLLVVNLQKTVGNRKIYIPLSMVLIMWRNREDNCQTGEGEQWPGPLGG